MNVSRKPRTLVLYFTMAASTKSAKHFSHMLNARHDQLQTPPRHPPSSDNASSSEPQVECIQSMRITRTLALSLKPATPRAYQSENPTTILNPERTHSQCDALPQHAYIDIPSRLTLHAHSSTLTFSHESPPRSLPFHFRCSSFHSRLPE